MEKNDRVDRAATLEEICAALSFSPNSSFAFDCTCGIHCDMKFDLSDATFVMAEELAWIELAREARDAKSN
jgi:hypothetical protein